MTLFNHWLFWMKDCRFQQTVVTQRILAGQDMSWRSLQHVFNVLIFRLPRRLEDFFKTSWTTKNCCAEGAFKMSWRHVLKTFWRHVLKTSWRRLVEKQKVYWGCLYLTNINSSKSIFPKFISDETKTNPKCID